MIPITYENLFKEGDCFKLSLKLNECDNHFINDTVGDRYKDIVKNGNIITRAIVAMKTNGNLPVSKLLTYFDIVWLITYK